MKKIIGVRFKKPGKIYFFDPGNLEINKNDNVIVETTMGEEIGIVIVPKREIQEEKMATPLKKVIRVANKNDLDSLEKYKKKEPEALRICKEKIKKYKLDMNLIDVEYKFDGSKILFYFTADGRIDFRELVKDLAAVFRTRIELRQIGVRDEVKKIGGNGVCGRELCCCSFLDNFEAVSIKMAKEQNVSLNPSKISGNCGRLMCCLKYEDEVYQEKIKRLPHVGAIVKTPEGVGEVDSVETLAERIKVKLKNGENYSYKKFLLKEIKVIKTSNAPSRASRYTQEGDVIFSMVRPYLRNIAKISINDCIASTGFYVCRPLDMLPSEYCYYLMISDYVVCGLNQFMKGDNSPSISKGDIDNWLFPLPPFSEQQRIVGKIEKLFSVLDSIQCALEA